MTRVRVAGAWVVCAVVVAAILAGGGGTPAPSGTANVWVDTNGGTCTRTAAAAYSDAAACATVDAAWDAMSAGETARIAPGTYGGQLITGNKASETFVIGDPAGVTFAGAPADPGSACPNAPGVDPFQTGIVCITANFLTLEDVTIDQEDTVREATGIGQANGADITFRDVNFHGERPSFQAQGDRFHWDGGEIGETGQAAGQRWCGDGNPMTLNGDGVIIENLTVWPQGSDQTPYTPTPCGSATSPNGFHLEVIRPESASGTIRNVNFRAGSEAGSGLIFWTGSGTGSWTVEGNYFGTNSDGSTSFQINATVTSCNWTWRYNTLTQGNANACTNSSSVWVGNLGNLGCDGTHTKNVQQRGSACGTDTIVAGTAGALDNLGLNSDGTLQSGSVAVDAGEATCSTVTPDTGGTVRPQGSACDAGAFERLP